MGKQSIILSSYEHGNVNN